MPTSLRTSFSLALAVACIALAAPHVARADDGGDGRERGGDGDELRVERVSFPVTLADGNTYSIVGQLYHRGELHERILQVCVHGATYDHRYWDVPPLDGVDYSYARYMARRGYAVLAIDQLGTGESGRPQGDFLNLEQTASGLHQVLASLHAEDNPLGHRRFDRVALVGHSNGSATSIRAQGTFHDADALVVTGWEHTPQVLPLDPSALAPFFASPYILFPPPVSLGLREALFYYNPAADPAMVTYDANTLTSPISRGQLSDLLFALTPHPTLDGVAGVTGPVLVQLGDHDVIAPSAFASVEAAFYASASSVRVQSLVNIGHVVNTHIDHLQSWTRIDDWLGDTLRRDGDDHHGD